VNLELKALSPSGKKKAKKLMLDPVEIRNYGVFNWADFKSSEDFYRFKVEWDTHQVMREILSGLNTEEVTPNPTSDAGINWTNLSESQEKVFKNLACIVLGLRQKVENAEEAAREVSRRLDRV
jgi:hypothetical protein